MANDCLFCRIIQGEAPGERVYEDERVVALKDKYPKAPVHILLLPQAHIPTLDHLDDPSLAGHLLLTARMLARQLGLEEEGYRVTINVGRGGGQAIFHLHLHLLGGRPFRW